MIFQIEKKQINQKRILNYIIEEYSFDMEPCALEISFNISINDLTLGIDNDDYVIQLWGFSPDANWIKSDYCVPQYKKGSLKVQTDLKAGFSYKLNKIEWSVYINDAGWICVGNPTAFDEAIEFIDNCIAIIKDGKLVALWLKPNFV